MPNRTLRTSLLFLLIATFVAITLQNQSNQNKIKASTEASAEYQRVRRATTRRPGFFKTFFSVIYEQWQDTKNTIGSVNRMINDNFLPENAPRVETTTSSDPDATTTNAPYKITRSEFNRILRRNLKGLIRLYNIELKDALSVSQRRPNVRELAEYLAKQQRRGKVRSGKQYLSSLKREQQIDDHLLSLADLSKRYNVDLETGHSEETALDLLLRNGPNKLLARNVRPRWFFFILDMFYGFSSLLWVGAIVSLVAYFLSEDNLDADYELMYLGVVIILIILVTGAFKFYHGAAHSAIMESFKKLIPKNATVLREGNKYIIPSEQLVLGDLVQVNAGDSVPADIRIILASQMKVDNSTITGVHEPVVRSPKLTDTNPLETHNLAFYGSSVVEGAGVGVVIACGENTLMGHIAALTSDLAPEKKSRMKKELSRFIVAITIASAAFGLALFGITIYQGRRVITAFLHVIAILMANEPEGLLVTLTACSTIAARKMAKKNCLCKNMQAIETLGTITVICTDKRGMLTQSVMTVSHMYYDDTIYNVLSEDETYNPDSIAFQCLCRVGILCIASSFTLDSADIMKRGAIGDANESAILKCMERLLGSTEEIRMEYEKIFEVPFNSITKYQISIHKIPGSKKVLLVTIGAPDHLIFKCSRVITNGKEVPLTMSEGKKLKFALHKIGFMGEKVVAFADTELPDQYTEDYKFSSDPLNFPVKDLRFVGYMSIVDPPRPEVPSAVKKCRAAGIKVVMVTGDHPSTAVAIAEQVGIISESNLSRKVRRHISDETFAMPKAQVITGTDLRNMTEKDLKEIIETNDEIVFARTSPQQKLQIVEAFQKAQHIVAVTGCGVNDSPALKQADIGIAKRIRGSDVSREAADMIILDDNFTSIVYGIEEGRLILENMKKSMVYMLSSNVPEIVNFILFIVLNIPLPLSIMAIMVIDFGTDLWPGISLAYEAAEADIMNSIPKRPYAESLVNSKLLYFAFFQIGVIQSFAGLSCYFFVMANYGYLPDKLVGLHDEWASERNDVLDSYNRQWTRQERIVLEGMCYSAYFFAIVLTQIANCLICKTRRLSIFQQGMDNIVLNIGLLFEIGLALIVVYCPVINTVLGFKPISLIHVIPAIPFALMILLFDEARKYFIRTTPGGWVERETYY